MSDTLLLNADAQPVSYLPLSTLCWQDAIKYMVLEKGRVLEWHDNWIVRSARWETRVPSIIMLTEYMKPKVTVRFSKGNIFLRDRYTCQYCGIKLVKSDCTLDHVLPVSHGGKSTFENSTTSCGPCNASKANDKRIKPKIRPYKPDFWELVNKRKEMGFQVKHDSWLDYIK